MAALVAVSLPTQLPDPSAARKRRREILASQRQALEGAVMVATLDAELDGAEPLVKRIKSSNVSICSSEALSAETMSHTEDDMATAVASFVFSATTLSSATSAATANATKKNLMAAKKPQMKYDPEVPMTKEEAAVWRREQRRKRNRESAAMSRQRQRDRIADLEVEVDEWKTKVEAIMDRIKKLEDASGIDSRNLVPELDLVPNQSLELELIHNTSTFVSPPSSPGRDSPVSSSPEASPIASSCIKSVVFAVVDQVLGGIGEELEHSDKMISRHAVKIADAPALPLFPKSDSLDNLTSPELCLSGEAVDTNKSIRHNPVTATAAKLEPIDSSLFPIKHEEGLPTLLPEEENEDEFGEFLLDAVQWL